MRLLGLVLHEIGPFDEAVVRFTTAATTAAPPERTAPDARGPDARGPEDEAAPAPAVTPRPVTVLFGGDGTGKTTLVSALAQTRPGHALPPSPSPAREPRRVSAAGERASYAATEWALGDDDPSRPHPLVVASPGATFAGETPEAAAARRREQALFDRRAQHEGGHVFVSFSGARWFSRVPNMLTSPERSILRYDVRQPGASFDDPTRADLARETKQVLSYASIAAALGRRSAEFERLVRFEAALEEVLDVVLEPFGLAHAGVSPTTLEPQARSMRGGVVPFDAIPRAARHLIAFVALPLRALFVAYPGSESPREHEGVVAIDDVESQQEAALLREILPLLRRALPNVQWIFATASTQLALACDASEVIALRRTSTHRVELGEGLLH